MSLFVLVVVVLVVVVMVVMVVVVSVLELQLLMWEEAAAPPLQIFYECPARASHETQRDGTHCCRHDTPAHLAHPVRGPRPCLLCEEAEINTGIQDPCNYYKVKFIYLHFIALNRYPV